MRSKEYILLPRFQRMLEQTGEQIKLARKRRKLTTVQVAERAGIDRTTLYYIEKGSASVSIGAFIQVLMVLGMAEDILKLASDDPLGRQLQDMSLLNRSHGVAKKVSTK